MGNSFRSLAERALFSSTKFDMLLLFVQLNVSILYAKRYMYETYTKQANRKERLLFKCNGEKNVHKFVFDN